MKQDDTVAALRDKYDALRREHENLKHTLYRGLRITLHKHRLESDVVQEFVNKSMATVVAWMASETCHQVIRHIIDNFDMDVRVTNLVSWLIYAVLSAIFVPFALWSLRRWSADANTTILSDQVNLAKLCLPMCFAWAFRDVVRGFIGLKHETQVWWPDLIVACSITFVIASCEVLPCYRRSMQATQAGGAQDTLLSRIAIMPGKLGLAVGYAWNQVLSWPKVQLQKQANTPLFVMMIQMLYFLVITSAITATYLVWHKRVMRLDAERKVAEAQSQKSTSEVEKNEAQETTTSRTGIQNIIHAKSDFISEFTSSALDGRSEQVFLDQTGQVMIDALAFVYAWAQLDTVNDFLFTYLLHCPSAKECSYQANFGFACAVTAVFTRLAKILKAETRVQAWNQAVQELTQKALSLNVGWAWSNFCYAAIMDARETADMPRLWTYVICAAFSWLAMSVLHRKFEIERRAWDRHINNEAVSQNSVIA